MPLCCAVDQSMDQGHGWREKLAYLPWQETPTDRTLVSPFLCPTSMPHLVLFLP